ncbi:MAG: metallopeptidase family protein [Chloroflexi bacterium]|nr:metallopeptidase family protein [Chloroflexota bacterium]
MRYEPAVFEQLVAQAVDSLPDWVRERMDNIAVVVQSWPSADQLKRSGIGQGRTLLGLYEGIPLTQRGRGYLLTPPDRITLFQGPLESMSCGELSLQRLVRRTVIHEIAHHFGISDERLSELDI